MNLTQAIKSVFKKYAAFSGRASRSEFWYWQLFCLVFSIVSSVLDALVFHASSPGSFQPISTIFMLIIFLPSLAVSVRRLHDVDRSGWWLLISLTFIGFFFPLLYWDVKKGTEGDNRFGSNPLLG